jgi:hypothetical protein
MRFGADDERWFDGSRLPPHVLLKILELSDYNLDLLRVNRFMRSLPAHQRAAALAPGLEHRMAYELLTSDGGGRASWLGPDYVALNVDKVVDVVAGRTAGARWLRDAIVAAARDDDHPAHAAMLVRASFFKDVGKMTTVDVDRAKAAAELFAALRPSIKRELRKERIGTKYIFEDLADEEMEELVDHVGGDPDEEPLVFVDSEPYTDLVDSEPYPDSDSDSDSDDSVTDSPPFEGAYASDPRGSIRKNVAMYMDAAQKLVWRGDVIAPYGPISFWRTSAVTRLSRLFDWRAYVRSGNELDDEVRATYRYFDTVRLFSANLYWDTRNVTHMVRTFAGCRFVGELNHLNVSRVTTFEEAFRGVEGFSGPLDMWRPLREPNMDNMFALVRTRLFNEIEPSLWWYGPQGQHERRARAERMQRLRWERYLSRLAS